MGGIVHSLFPEYSMTPYSYIQSSLYQSHTKVLLGEFSTNSVPSLGKELRSHAMVDHSAIFLSIRRACVIILGPFTPMGPSNWTVSLLLIREVTTGGGPQ